MDRVTQASLIRAILRRSPAERAGRGAAETYHPVRDSFDPNLYEREVRAIYRRSPLIVAHVSQLQRPGDFVTETVCGIPILVTRAASGKVNAFLNVCRHRNALLVTERAGRKPQSFVCGYHAWSYDTQGQLTHVPDRAESFPGLDCQKRGLVALPVEVRAGFVWVTLQPATSASSPAPDLDQHLGALGPELDSYGFEDYVFYREEELSRPFAFNWKVAMESFVENYHFAVLHKDSTHPIFMHNTIDTAQLGQHIRALAPKRSLAGLANVDESAWDLRPHATIHYSIFPNSCLFVEKNHFSLLQLLPEGAERCRVKAMHVVGSDGLRYRQHWEENIALFMAAVNEDLAICESMQAGLRSGADDCVVFGRNEAGCDMFRRTVAAAMARE